jgi:hypothetical protein
MAVFWGCLILGCGTAFAQLGGGYGGTGGTNGVTGAAITAGATGGTGGDGAAVVAAMAATAAVVVVAAVVALVALVVAAGLGVADILSLAPTRSRTPARLREKQEDREDRAMVTEAEAEGIRRAWSHLHSDGSNIYKFRHN